VDFIKETAGVERVSLVAHSWGGVVAYEFAAGCPQCIDRMVIIGCPYRTLHSGFAAVADAAIQLAKNGTGWVENRHHLLIAERTYSFEQPVMDWYTAMIARDYPLMPSGVFLEFDDWAYSRLIPEITAPTLLVAGADEYVVDRSDVLCCLDDLGAEEKDLLFIGHAAHLIFLEHDGHRRLNEAVAAWIIP
jgi:pimeloyl-ACP methyl ester carboxylesterase